MTERSDRFRQDGYILLRGALSEGDIASMRDEIVALGTKLVGEEFRFDVWPSAASREIQSQLYDALKYLPSLYNLASRRDMLDLCRELGLEFPCVMGSCNMRMDLPSDDLHLFAWHQDSVYLLGSANAVTIWVPLTTVDAVRGTIAVIPGSHTCGVYPFKKVTDKPAERHVPLLQRDVQLDIDVDMSREVVITAEPGDVVVFSQMCLHRSLPNRSAQTRWTCQLRIGDLFDEQFIAMGYPMGERTNIFFADYGKGR